MNEQSKKKVLEMFTTKEEKMQLANILDQVAVVEKRNTTVFTSFLDPIKAAKYQTAINKVSSLPIVAFGGYEAAERMVFGIGQQTIPLEDFPIQIIKIQYHSKFSKPLTHRSFLGAILSLGIDRGKIGDIIVNEDHALVFAEKEIATFIETQLEKVGNVTVQCSIVTEGAIRAPEPKQEKRVTVASLRLDVVLCECFHLSRSKASALIQGEKALVNWSVCSNNAKLVQEGDVVTLRGTGRIKIVALVGETKRGKIALVVEIYAS